MTREGEQKVEKWRREKGENKREENAICRKKK